MNIYKYVCLYCGEVSTQTNYQGVHYICGHCRHRKVLLDANKLTDWKQLGL